MQLGKLPGMLFTKSLQLHLLHVRQLQCTSNPLLKPQIKPRHQLKLHLQPKALEVNSGARELSGMMPKAIGFEGTYPETCKHHQGWCQLSGLLGRMPLMVKS